MFAYAIAGLIGTVFATSLFLAFTDKGDGKRKKLADRILHLGNPFGIKTFARHWSRGEMALLITFYALGIVLFALFGIILR